ncbi:PKD domain-containing protein [Lewinella sp. LCG006]|uniref:PKD domain-containing protein n=1 Tax=Lewinella sp. LCG006 TaxID=3231911 RepID=UPI00345F1E02
MRTFSTPSQIFGLFFFLFLYTDLGLLAQTADITSGCAPLTVAFTAPAGVSTPFWDFQNGGNATTLNPSAIFTTPGIYEVSLRVGQGGALVGTVTITVFTPPELGFTVDTNRGCAPLTLHFASELNVDPGIGITSYNWVFGDGGSGQGPNPVHAYGSPGLYDLSLNLVTNQEGCDQTQVFPSAITVGGVQNLNFFTNPNPAVACEPPLSVAFANITPQLPGLTFSWDFGNGSTFNGAAPPAEVYTNSGNFEVLLTGTDSLGCTASRNRFVNVYEGSVPLNAPDTVCLNEYVYYQNFVVADGVNWTFPDNVVETLDDFMVPVIVFTEPGWQTLTVRTETNTPIFCEQDSTFQIYVDDVDESLTASPNYTCENELTIDFTASSTTGATFIWLYYDMNISAGAQTTHTYTYVDTLEYAINGLVQYYTTLYATNPSGCRDTLIRVDTIFTPNALFMPDVSSGCAPLTVTFSDSTFSFEPVISYVYDYGDGTSATFTTDASNSHTYTEPGVYEVVLSIENEAGCRDTSYVRRIEVGAPLDIDFTYDDAVVCVDDTIQFTVVNPPPEVDWYELVEPDTLYYYYNGCLSQTVNPDIIIEGPDVELSYEIDCASPYEVRFTSSTYDATNVVWDFGDGTTSNAPNPVHEYSVTGDFWVYVTAFNSATSCPSRTDSTLICIRDLQVDFEIPSGACVGESIDLDASGTVDVNGEFCAYGFTWMFEQNGRPIMGNDTILPFTFTVPGQDRVTLIAKDVNGCKDTLSRLINVYSITPDFIANDTFICMPGTVNFTDLSLADTTLVSWTWNFGDNTSSTSPSSATHTYTNVLVDSIAVVLLVEDAQGCTARDTLAINIYTPISQIISDLTPLNICEGETINLSATQFTDGGSSLTFEWDFGVGGSPVAGMSVSNMYPTAGSYPLTLYYEEIGTGCTGQNQATVNVQAYPQAGFTSSVDDEEVVCAPAQIAFMNTSTAAGGMNYQWNFGNGSFSSAPNPVTTFNRGEFTVTLVATTSYGCADTLQQNYEVEGPVGTFTFGPQAICEGESVTFELVDTMDVTSFSWDLGDGTVISDVNPLVYTYENVPVLGNRPVTLTLLGANDACELSVTETLLIRNVQAGFSIGDVGDSLFCAGTYTLNNESVGANSYTWVLPDGSTANNFEPEFTVAPGIYTVSLTVEDTDLGCVSALSQTFTFTQPTFAQAIGDTICPGDTARLTLPGLPSNAEVLWAPVTGFLSPATAANPLVLATQTTTYGVIVTDSVGCVSNSMATIHVIAPYLWEDIDETACPGDSLLIELPVPDSFFIITWQPSPPPDVIGDLDIDLELMIQDINGCYEDTYRFFVQSVSDSIIVPNIFSPNGDGINDEFRLFTEIDLDRTDMINIKSFRVYNRWGQEVYEGSGPLARWDGTNNGKPAPSEVYIYHIVVDVLKAGREEEFKGQVTLVR